MTTVPGTGSSSGSSSANTSSRTVGGGFDAVNSDQFLTLLLAEMKNQDPLEPMKNSDMIQQMSQIRSIGATDQLTGTLSTLRESQELVTASGLIGHKVEGLSDNAQAVEGVVDRITVDTDSEKNSRTIKVHVGDQTMSIRNIRTIVTQ